MGADVYANTAYLREKHEDIVDNSLPLLVTAVGNYRINKDGRQINTVRPNGRGDYQLLYVAEGRLRRYKGEKEERINKGTMLLFRPQEEQIYSLLPEDTPETYWVHFTGSDAEDLLSQHGLNQGKTFIYAGLSPDYQWLFRQMIEELQLTRSAYQEVLNLSLKHLLLLINRHLEEENEKFSVMTDEVERAAHFFGENYNRDINIKKYAKDRNVNLCLFIRKFKEVFKVTPMQYVLSLRINNAKNLMSATDYNISQVAASVGYDNALYFTRLFKRHTGMSPTEYKKRG